MRRVEHLPPAAFAYVMATGIVSTAALLLHFVLLSLALLVLAAAGFVLLAAALALRLVLFPAAVRADLVDAGRAFGFFTVVAGCGVLAVRLALLGAPRLDPVVLALGALALLVWALLTYTLPALLTLGGATAVRAVNGTWLIWVVGTESLAALAAVLGTRHPSLAAWLAPAAVSFWALGAVLYAILVVLVYERLFFWEVTAEALGPPYWIVMGATAITVLAGARILGLPAGLPVVAALAPLVRALTYVFWTFGTSWIPLLLLFGVWRHALARHPVAYETALWGMVFPLGMYTASSLTFARAAHLAFLAAVARVAFPFALAAWLAVFAGFLVALVRALRVPPGGRQAAEPASQPRGPARAGPP